MNEEILKVESLTKTFKLSKMFNREKIMFNK